MANPRFNMSRPVPTVPDTTILEDYLAVFTTPQGQRVLDHIVSTTQGSIDRENIDTNKTVWIIAQQNLVTFIYRQIERGRDAMEPRKQ